jgi:outer membrane receptor protein involved in Fe transport
VKLNSKHHVLRASLSGAFLAASLLIASTAAAQSGQATMTGTVTDASTHQPVGDVVVTATSPQAQGEQVVVTDSSGTYRIPQLPPGTYSLRLEKESYKPFSRADISLRIDATTRLNIELLPEALKEDVVVIGRPPTIDVGSSTTGVTIGQDFIQHLALVNPGARGGSNRSFESLALVAPTASEDMYGVAISGTTSPENKYIIDGISQGDPGYGVNGTPLSVEFVQQVNVITGGYMPEYGRSTGGTMNVVTKSGSNEFHGSIFGTFTPGALDGTPHPIKANGSIYNDTLQLWNTGDFGAEIGGPIIKDKLWFYAGINPSFQRYGITQQIAAISYVNAAGQPCAPTGISVADPADGFPTGAPMSEATYASPATLPGLTSGYPSDSAGCHIQLDKNGLIVTNPIAGTNRTYFADKQALSYIGKLTYLLSADHTLTLSIYGTPQKTGGPHSFGYNTQSDSPQTGELGCCVVAGDFGAIAQINYESTNTISLKESSSFLDKRLLLDVTVGWYHQEDGTTPIDGSALGSSTGLAGLPNTGFARSYGGADMNGNTIGYRSLLAFQDLGAGDAACTNSLSAQSAQAQQLNALLCPTTWESGGPGYITQASLNRYEGSAVITYLLNAAGHHVFKLGGDVEALDYNRVKANTGLISYSESTDGTYFVTARNFGFLTGPDQIFLQALKQADTQSLTAGAFVQDSWNVLDLFTLNAGVRYDQQAITGADGQLGLNMPGQWAPRLGFIFDPTQKGRAKLFGSYSVNFLTFPLDLADRSLPGEPGLVGLIKAPGTGGTCTNPSDRSQSFGGGCDPTNNANLLNFGGGYGSPNPGNYWQGYGNSREAIDPNIQPESTTEWNAGGEYELIENGRLGVTYDKRYYNNVIEDMSPDEGNTFFIGNPGYGLATDRPRAVRNYDAVSVYFTKEFSDLWMAQVSYTWSQLIGNYEGLILTNYLGQLDPGISAAFDLKSLLPNVYGNLPGDVTHRIKVFGAKKFVLTGSQAVDLGLTFTAHSGSPLNYLGAQYLYGPGVTYLLPQGSAGNLPWVYDIDGHLTYTYQFSKDTALTLGADLFNLFNFQGTTSVDQNYTFAATLPVTTSQGICSGTVPGTSTNDCTGPKLTPSQIAQYLGKIVYGPNAGATKPLGSPLQASDLNPNFKQPNAYQAPRTVRFLARLTF